MKIVLEEYRLDVKRAETPEGSMHILEFTDRPGNMVVVVVPKQVKDVIVQGLTGLTIPSLNGDGSGLVG